MEKQRRHKGLNNRNRSSKQPKPFSMNKLIIGDMKCPAVIEQDCKYTVTENCKYTVTEDCKYQVTDSPVRLTWQPHSVLSGQKCLIYLLLFSLLLATGTSSQRAPCYGCELYRDTHPFSNPYQRLVKSLCKPCKCLPEALPCPFRPKVGADPCGCCCGERQHQALEGEGCGAHRECTKGLRCVYDVPGEDGTCKVVSETECDVNGTFYRDGETFKPDCRTQCTCSNGVYACVSLCPQEALTPSPKCRHPRLLERPHRCCREWICDPDPDLKGVEKNCELNVSRWSTCSSLTCGLGLSQRWATDELTCRPALQTRLCQLRPCEETTQKQTIPRMIRRSHHCKATLRTNHPQRLVAGPCVSQRKYRPKQCNECPRACCTASMDTTIKVVFLCPLHGVPPYLLPDEALVPSERAAMFDLVTDTDSQRSKMEDLTVDDDVMYTNMTSSSYEIVQKQVQWILRCRCTPTCQAPTPRTFYSNAFSENYL